MNRVRNRVMNRVWDRVRNRVRNRVRDRVSDRVSDRVGNRVAARGSNSSPLPGLAPDSLVASQARDTSASPRLASLRLGVPATSVWVVWRHRRPAVPSPPRARAPCTGPLHFTPPHPI